MKEKKYISIIICVGFFLTLSSNSLLINLLWYILFLFQGQEEIKWCRLFLILSEINKLIWYDTLW